MKNWNFQELFGILVIFLAYYWLKFLLILKNSLFQISIRLKLIVYDSYNMSHIHEPLLEVVKARNQFLGGFVFSSCHLPHMKVIYHHKKQLTLLQMHDFWILKCFSLMKVSWVRSSLAPKCSLLPIEPSYEIVGRRMAVGSYSLFDDYEARSFWWYIFIIWKRKPNSLTICKL